MGNSIRVVVVLSIIFVLFYVDQSGKLDQGGGCFECNNLNVGLGL